MPDTDLNSTYIVVNETQALLSRRPDNKQVNKHPQSVISTVEKRKQQRGRRRRWAVGLHCMREAASLMRCPRT